ncbi:glycoside hydrolase family 65 protein [Gorillibacterium sp. sgz500922]|uniref:glycoside hydrolase family 65 protein n=1 Tax=Gorillibacterium sp. sgz500922 TaxID=3446694 RepID=UPI003F675FE8
MATEWLVREEGWDPGRIVALGNKFMTGNGYLGYRGTLEEYTKEQLVAVNLAGLYDRVGAKWREPVNAPNGLWTRLALADGRPLTPESAPPLAHAQQLELRTGVHRRETVYPLPGEDGACVRLTTERFVSMDRRHVLALAGSIRTTADCRLLLATGIDGDVWDINGPHLQAYTLGETDGLLGIRAVSQEQQVPVAVAEGFVWLAGDPAADEPQEGHPAIDANGLCIRRTFTLDCRAGVEYRFFKVAAVYTGLDGEGEPEEAARRDCREALAEGWDALRDATAKVWSDLWDISDVQIGGDPEAQLALRYSMYQLLIAAPAGERPGSIPARGLSGQVYKGAIFWDTELFMLPFFLHTQPELARNLLLYRCRTLDGARRKAAEYGFEGAFFAWESQDTGDDACTLFNVTDVFTGRPMRTYFRDKQIHISADVAHGIWSYVQLTGDDSLLLDGGAETVLECARFFLSYGYYQPVRDRYELLDVTGPDEYHERVNNNAFTNYMAARTLDIALETVDYLRNRHPDRLDELFSELAYAPALDQIRRMREKLYLPAPDPRTGLIEQFDRYLTLEDVPLRDLRSRQLHPSEYWGGGSGLATTTQILKQADTVLLLHLFRDRFPREVIRANWEYYEPRTEHGSSLSACIYAMVAADIGLPDWGYPYFMKTATIDLTGESKTYVGDLYIGGVHSAANGGAWMAAIFGFAGLSVEAGRIRLKPALPSVWTSVRFAFRFRGQAFALTVGRESVTVEPLILAEEQVFAVAGREYRCRPGETLAIRISPTDAPNGSQ